MAQRYQLTDAHGALIGFMWLVGQDDDKLEAAAKAALDTLDPPTKTAAHG